MTSSLPSVRAASGRDVPGIVALVRELAAFEALEHEVQLTPERLNAALFGERPAVEAVVAELDGHVVAYAMYFTNFSSFLGLPGLYLEDLYVQPAQRGAGLGEALLRHLAGVAVARGYGRFEWTVLDWNVDAQRFYRRLGAEVLPDWRVCRVTGDALRVLAVPQARAAD